MAFRCLPQLRGMGLMPGIVNCKKLYVAKYKCDNCGEKWKVKKTQGDVKNCQTCNNPVFPYKKEVINRFVHYKCEKCGFEVKEKRCASEVANVPFCKICRCDMILVSTKNLTKPRRMFGDFCCTKCNRFWRSGNAWEDKGQECRVCGTLVYPHTLRPLRPRFGGDQSREPHDQERCQMCQELGYNCKGYTPPIDNNVDDEDVDEVDDDLSVITGNSSVTEDLISREGSDLDDADLTPTEDDFDENLQIATKELSKMKLK